MGIIFSYLSWWLIKAPCRLKQIRLLLLISHYQIKSHASTYCNFITWNALTAQKIYIYVTIYFIKYIWIKKSLKKGRYYSRLVIVLNDTDSVCWRFLRHNNYLHQRRYPLRVIWDGTVGRFNCQLQNYPLYIPLMPVQDMRHDNSLNQGIDKCHGRTVDYRKLLIGR